MNNTQGKFKIVEVTAPTNNIIGAMKSTRHFEYKRLTFSAGEVHVQLQDKGNMINIHNSFDSVIVIEGRITSSEDLIELLMLNDAIDTVFVGCRKQLDLYYTPFSRQDRVANPGEALSIKVFANLINSCNFTKVITYDNHSSVSTALINNCIDNTQTAIFKEAIKKNPLSFDYIISPDAGANKKSFDIATMFGVDMIQADKKRSTQTGEITGTVVHADSETLTGKTVMIADDICDGGRTVIEIAKVLKAKGVDKIYCYFTHGIFSKGVDALLDANIDHIYTTNSFEQEENEKLTTLVL